MKRLVNVNLMNGKWKKRWMDDFNIHEMIISDYDYHRISSQKSWMQLKLVMANGGKAKKR